MQSWVQMDLPNTSSLRASGVLYPGPGDSLPERARLTMEDVMRLRRRDESLLPGDLDGWRRDGGGCQVGWVPDSEICI